MSAKKKTTKRKAASKKTAKSFEEILWDSVNTCRRVSVGSESEGTPQSVPDGCDAFGGSLGLLDWCGATGIPRPRDPQGKRGGANQFYTSKCTDNFSRIYIPILGHAGSSMIMRFSK